MKNLKVFAFGVLMTFAFCRASAQQTVPINEPDYNKPALFADVPSRVALNTTALEDLFRNREGSSATVIFSADFIFKGTVVSRGSSKEAESVVIRSYNRPGAAFTFTRVNLPDGTVKYIGRILSLKNSDAFEITQDGGLYYLQKKTLYELINE